MSIRKEILMIINEIDDKVDKIRRLVLYDNLINIIKLTLVTRKTVNNKYIEENILKHIDVNGLKTINKQLTEVHKLAMKKWNENYPIEGLDL